MPDFARAQLRRQWTNFGLFLGPALILLLVFFVAPMIIDVVLAFTDMGRTLALGEIHAREFRADVHARHALARRARHHLHLRGGDAQRLQRHFRAAAGAGDDRRATAPRRFLSRRVAAAADEPVGGVRAAVVVGDRPQRARTAQPDRDPCLRHASDRPAQQSSAAGDHSGQRLHRGVAGHAHLHVGHTLDSRAPVPRRSRRRRRIARHRPPRHAAGAALANLLHDDPSDRCRCS